MSTTTFVVEFQEQIESPLLLMDHFFFFSIHLERGRPGIGLHVRAPKKTEKRTETEK